MEKVRLPQLTEAAYAKVRDAFRKSMPSKVTPTWVMTNIAGYNAEASAKSLIANLRLFGLVTEEGAPTELAGQWRLDETYGPSCDAILRNAFPVDLVGAVGDSTTPSADVLVNLFMNLKMGLGSAKNLTRIFRLIASKEL